MTLDDMKNLSIKEAAVLFVSLKNQLAEIGENEKIVREEFDNLRKIALPELMESLDFETVNIAGIGRISLRAEIYASIKKDVKEDAYRWLAENGHGALIKDTVNASSLKAFIKEQMVEGETFPEELFTVLPFTMATLTKS